MPHHAHSRAHLYEHLAGVNDLLLAVTTFEAAAKQWRGAKITLRNGTRIIEKTWPDQRLIPILTLNNPRSPNRGARWT